MKCPCNENENYLDCCAKVHENIYNGITSEMLMRSRYSAFVLDKMDYLRISHAKSTVKSFNFKNTSKWTKSVKWLKLDILNKSEGTQFDLIGYVEFKAYFLENGNIDFIHGKSRFIKQDNHWVYLDEI